MKQVEIYIQIKKRESPESDGRETINKTNSLQMYKFVIRIPKTNSKPFVYNYLHNNIIQLQVSMTIIFTNRTGPNRFY